MGKPSPASAGPSESLGKEADGFEQTIKLAQDHPDMVPKLKVCMKLASQNDGRVPVVAAQAQGLTIDDLELMREYRLLE